MSKSLAESNNVAPRLLLAVVVSVSILQTPLPIAHAHSEIESASGLASHVTRHHGDHSVLAHEIHWHLVLPGDFEPHADSDHPSESDSPQIPAATGVSVSAIGGVVTAIAELNRLESENCLVALLRSTRVTRGSSPSAEYSTRPAHILTSSKRTCALLCVIRC